MSGVELDALEAVARAFSPRVEVHAPHLVTLDIAGLGRLLGTPAEIGRELVRDARERGCAADVAIAASRTAAMLLALACDGLTVALPGDDSRLLASLPLGVLARLPEAGSRPRTARSETKKSVNRSIAKSPNGEIAKSRNREIDKSPNREIGKSPNQPITKSETDSLLPVLALFRRWGLRTLGDLAALPSAALSERIGQDGLRWQRVARGEDLEPLVAMPPEAPIEEVLDLDWPVEGLEPLSFLLPRLLDPICERLERLDQAAVGLELSFRLATREQEPRHIQLPAPMRDAKVLRTLILLHLESHPLGAGVDRLGIRIETAPARIVQFSLLARALPFPEQIATLLARLGALMGERRVGSPAVVDSHRPGAFAMEAFTVDGRGAGSRQQAAKETTLVLRRFRLPVAARVIEQEGRPVRVTTERRGLEGGRVEAAAGPWRTSGEWWKVGGNGSVDSGQWTVDSKRESPPTLPVGCQLSAVPWNRDEWDVALTDGALYLIYRDRATERWFVEGILD